MNEDDGMWQFLCNQEHNIETSDASDLETSLRADPSIGELKDLPLERRLREHPQMPWRTKIEDESLGNRRK